MINFLSINKWSNKAIGAAIPIISIIGKDPAIAVDGTASLQIGYFVRSINRTTNKSVIPIDNNAHRDNFDQPKFFDKAQIATRATNPVVTSPIPELINSIGPIPEVATKKKTAPSTRHNCPKARLLKEMLLNIILKFLLAKSARTITTGINNPNKNFGNISSGLYANTSFAVKKYTKATHADTVVSKIVIYFDFTLDLKFDFLIPSRSMK